jgi:hypothetical protein
MLLDSCERIRSILFVELDAPSIFVFGPFSPMRSYNAFAKERSQSADESVDIARIALFMLASRVSIQPLNRRAVEINIDSQLVASDGSNQFRVISDLIDHGLAISSVA